MLNKFIECLFTFVEGLYYNNNYYPFYIKIPYLFLFLIDLLKIKYIYSCNGIYYNNIESEMLLIEPIEKILINNIDYTYLIDKYASNIPLKIIKCNENIDNINTIYIKTLFESYTIKDINENYNIYELYNNKKSN
jgi:hypothetical protein